MNTKKQAQGIAALGRYGDTTLMHMRPDEVEQLTALSRANGGDITINPKTGMPEAFLGDFFSALAPMAAGAAANYFVPGSGFAAKYATPFVAGAATKAVQGQTDPGSLIMGGIGGIGGANLGQSIQDFGNPELVSTAADVADDVAVDQVASKGLEAGTDMTKAYATNVPQMSGTQGVSMYTPQGQVFNQGVVRTGDTLGPQGITGYQPTSVYNQGLAPDFTAPAQTGAIGSPYPRFDAGGFEATSAVAEPQGFLTSATDNIKSGIRSITDTLGTTAKQSSENYGKAFDRLSEEGVGSYLSEVGGGDKFIGGIKTALPFAGAGYEAYQKSLYEGLPKYADSAGMYDPTRKLNLGMDTGLRLLAEGGEVKKYVLGGRVADEYTPTQLSSLAEYGVVPQYQKPQSMGINPGGDNINYNTAAYRQPVTGVVDVGGKFVADPKGNITDVEYTNKYKYILEGPAKQDQDSGGDMDAINQGAVSGMSVNPAAALVAASSYADEQQADTAETGLGGLKKGGTIKYQDGGGIGQLAQATPDDGKMLEGAGDGVSDDIPAMIEGEQEAALSDGEFIVPARIVSELGNGSSDAGAEKLYNMIDRIQAAREQTIGDNKEYAKDTNAERFLPV